MGKRLKDRKDAKRVAFPSLMQSMIDLKPNRCEAEVYINEKMDVTELVRYVEQKKAEGKHYTYFHAFMTAIGKVIYNKPLLNRFVANRHMYEHNTVSLAFVAKVSLTESSEELMLIMDVDPDETLDTFSEKLRTKVETLRKKSMNKSGANSAVDTLSKLPNPIRIPVMGILKWADARGLLPESLTGDNLYYSSMIVSNLGSIHCGAIYHNLTNFGTSSSLATIGEIRDEEVILADSTKEVRKMCEFGICLDERIADGFYFAQCAKMIQHILLHPHLLEEPASKKVEMV
ncbi:MAG: 2-oxo acid dehydrogenase subunit E2 [Lachnospiraceae bacterium]|nr:2-oxo acid dehydrogenase subunit E2 [Lachnospiraceae bacterium]